MALSNEQLLLLDNLIYTNYVDNGRTVRDIISIIKNNNYNINSCEMSSDEWKEIVRMIENDPVLLDYTVTNYKNDTNTGMRAACFVDDTSNPEDVNVVFRGTCGDYEWHDNGEGGYLSDSDQQKLAAEYVNNLPEEYGNDLTVTGHSKGGNKAQYVTIVTDRIGRCVSYDGQGFSEEFLNKYAVEIKKKAEKITSISASNDFVNCLLYTIAGTRIYVETEDQDNFLHYHKPNILLDDGHLRSETDQSLLSRFINEYTTYMISNLDEPERSATVDGLIAFLESGEDKESLLQSILAAVGAISHLDDFAFNHIGERYGVSAELLATLVASVICPALFIDDLLHSVGETIEETINDIKHLAEQIEKKLKESGEKFASYVNRFIEAINGFVSNVKNWKNNNLSAGYKYASSNPQIKLDTYKLSSYAQRLRCVNTRISNLDRRLDSLYWKVGLLGLWNLMQADLLVGYSWRLSRCASYLSNTATDFNSVENELINNV